MWVETTSRIASFTRRILAPGILENLGGRTDAALDARPIRKLRVDEALDRSGCLIDLPGFAGQDRGGQGGSLPQVVVVGLGDGGAEATLKRGLERSQLLALSLQ